MRESGPYLHSLPQTQLRNRKDIYQYTRFCHRMAYIVFSLASANLHASFSDHQDITKAHIFSEVKCLRLSSKLCTFKSHHVMPTLVSHLLILCPLRSRKCV